MLHAELLRNATSSHNRGRRRDPLVVPDDPFHGSLVAPNRIGDHRHRRRPATRCLEVRFVSPQGAAQLHATTCEAVYCSNEGKPRARQLRAGFHNVGNLYLLEPRSEIRQIVGFR